jgi:hypothetical protein
MPSSLEWRRYFEANAASLLEVPWELGSELTPDERVAITRSLQEFQAGESSEGKHLFRAAQDYAAKAGDPEYVAAIRLFIAEEQRHARDLARFLHLNDIPLVKTTLTDRVFRSMRRIFGGLEISVAVLITAEIIAKVYYAVLREATQSRILRRLCDQILSDELKHVEFQSEQLHRLRHGRGRLASLLTRSLQSFLYLGTVLVVWWFHRKVIRRGGLSIGGWWKVCWREFRIAFPSKSAQPAAQSDVDSNTLTSPAN